MKTNMNIKEWGKLSYQDKEIVKLMINGKIVYAISFFPTKISSVIQSFISNNNIYYTTGEKLDINNKIYILLDETDIINADVKNIFSNEDINVNIIVEKAFLKLYSSVNIDNNVFIAMLTDNGNIILGNSKNSIVYNIINSNYKTVIITGDGEETSLNKIVYLNYESDIIPNNGIATESKYKITIDKLSIMDAKPAEKMESLKEIAITYIVGGFPTLERLCVALGSILLPIVSDMKAKKGISIKNYKDIVIESSFSEALSCDSVCSYMGSFGLKMDMHEVLEQANVFLVFTNTELQLPIIRLIPTNGNTFINFTFNEVESLIANLYSILTNTNNIIINKYIDIEYLLKIIYQCIINIKLNNKIAINYRGNVAYKLEAIDLCKIVDLDKITIAMFDTMMVFK